LETAAAALSAALPAASPTHRAAVLTVLLAGWVSSMLASMAVLFAATVGMWVGRLGALRMVMAGLALAGLALAKLALASAASLAATVQTGSALLMGTRLAEGLGFMVVAVACPALISAATTAADRRLALSFWCAYMPAGASLAMLARR
jgi:MFS family permease